MSALLAILAVLGAAASTLVLKATLGAWPIGLAGAQSRVVTLVLLAAWILSRGAGWRRLPPRGQGLRLLVMGAISIAVNLLWFGAVRFTTATNVAMLMSLDLVFVVMIGAGLGLERIGLRQAALLPAMLLGMGLLTGSANGGIHWLGDLMAVGAAMAYAANAFLIRRILRHLDEEAVSLYNHALSTLGFLILIVAGGELAAAADAWRRPEAWLWLVALGLVAAVSLPIYYAALHRMEVWKLRACLLSAPVLVAVLEWQLWGNRLSGRQWLGVAMVLVSLALLIVVERNAGQARPLNDVLDERIGDTVPTPQPVSTL